jgi:hypothetical protein
VKSPVALILILVIAAYNNNPISIKTHLIVDSAELDKIVKASIDLIAAPFVPNFPDTVGKAVYGSEDSMWNIISGFYSYQEGEDLQLILLLEHLVFTTSLLIL